MLNGIIFKQALISGANNIVNHRQEVDALNVFPVPDGDTGTNMSMTISAAARELQVCEQTDIASVSAKAAAALLRGASLEWRIEIAHHIAQFRQVFFLMNHIEQRRIILVDNDDNFLPGLLVGCRN